jgi:hypothetical protein
MDDVRADLERDGRLYGRATEAQKRARAKLGETIRRAYIDGVGPAEITRLIDHRLTEKTVIRIGKGDA